MRRRNSHSDFVVFFCCVDEILICSDGFHKEIPLPLLLEKLRKEEIFHIDNEKFVDNHTLIYFKIDNEK